MANKACYTNIPDPMYLSTIHVVIGNTEQQREWEVKQYECEDREDMSGCPMCVKVYDNEDGAREFILGINLEKYDECGYECFVVDIAHEMVHLTDGIFNLVGADHYGDVQESYAYALRYYMKTLLVKLAPILAGKLVFPKKVKKDGKGKNTASRKSRNGTQGSSEISKASKA